MAEELHKI